MLAILYRAGTRRIGAPGRTRTCNPRLRRPMLYPVELRARGFRHGPEMVGVERFELPTSCSQSRRATRLRYTPINPFQALSDERTASYSCDPAPSMVLDRVIAAHYLRRQRVPSRLSSNTIPCSAKSWRIWSARA